MSKDFFIVDFFSYFHLTGKELLELRVRLLNEYVDKFVICESNKTQSGVPISYSLEETIKNLNLPKEKIEIIHLDIPDDPYLPVKDIDKINCYENNHKNIQSVLARTRERLQKDSLLKKLYKFKENTIFIVSDSDEIINPDCIGFLANFCENHTDVVIKVPLVHLEGRGDLRVFDRESGTPKMWDKGMFFCTKEHLLKATPTMIRSNVNNPFRINYISQNNSRLEDLGWHFSWMGNSSRRKIKRESFTHYSDTFSFLNNGSYNSENIIKFVEADTLKEGDIPPSGNIAEVLKEYDKNLLPKIIFDLPSVKNLLFN